MLKLSVLNTQKQPNFLIASHYKFHFRVVLSKNETAFKL